MNKLLALCLVLLSTSSLAANATFSWSGKIPAPTMTRDIEVTKQQISWDAKSKSYQYSQQQTHELPDQVELIAVSKNVVLVSLAI